MFSAISVPVRFKKAASAVDDAGLCANWFAKFVMGGCFVAGTYVTLPDIPRDQTSDDALWSDPVWHGTPYRDSSPDSRDSTLSKTATITSLLESPRRMLVPIEQVPIGARVPTKNPRPWEYDDSLPDPVQSEWGLIAMTMVRDDGGIVDAELIRPWAWIRTHRIEADKPMPMNIPELQVTGVAMVTSMGECPAIAEGNGSVITARFLTRQVEVIARAEILSADGSIEVLEGTTIHPIWSLDRNDWVPLGELEPDDQLSGQSGSATVLSLTLVNRPTAVYNIEVHGEHVYQVGDNGLLVHNAYATDAAEQGARGLWNLTEDGTSEIMRHQNFGKFFKSKSDDLWWSVDNAGHGESAFKVFKETGKGLKWYKDADRFGDFIAGKHKGPTGMFIPWKQLLGI